MTDALTLLIGAVVLAVAAGWLNIQTTTHAWVMKRLTHMLVLLGLLTAGFALFILTKEVLR